MSASYPDPIITCDLCGQLVPADAVAALRRHFGGSPSVAQIEIRHRSAEMNTLARLIDVCPACLSVPDVVSILDAITAPGWSDAARSAMRGGGS